MSRRSLLLTLCLCTSVSGLAQAQDLSPEQLARIRRDEQAALARVNAAHGNKKSSELSPAERKQIIREQQEASRKVMDAHGVSAKDYARQTARMGPKQNAEVATAEKALKAREKVPAKTHVPEEIPIQQGFSEDDPVTLEEQEGALPVVDQGMPADEVAPAEGEQTDLPIEALPAAEPKPGKANKKKR